MDQALRAEEEVYNYQQEQRVYEEYIEKKPSSLFVRFLITTRHLNALLIGGLFAYLRHRKETRVKPKISFTILKFFLYLTYPFLNKKLVNQPFSVQLRRRLEMLGATYIKLGQILSLREDILPKEITDELKKLLDTLPALKYERYVELLEEQLGQPIHRVFTEVQESPLGSASVAQAHRATLRSGEEVVIKLLKPGTRELIQTDSKIIKAMGSFLDIFIPQLQPKNMFTEFCNYTNKEVDFKLEAENAEIFAGNFIKQPDIVFPKIYRQFSTSDVLVMEFIRGMKPDENCAKVLTEEEKERVADLGAGAIISMLYHDGFFHADLHPGNLIILKDETGVKCAFIDLGMVGRFEETTRKSMLYYYNALVMGDSVSAARYLSLVARPGRGADPEGFRKEYAEVAVRWFRNPNFNDFSLALLIFQATVLGAKYRMYFPLEMVLMVKAIITFEGVGNVIKPGIDIAKLSRRHIRNIMLTEVNPLELLKQTLQNTPEMIDVVTRTPMLLMTMFKEAEHRYYEKPEEVKSPVDSMKYLVFGGFCILGACILVATGQPWEAYTALFVLGGIAVLKS
jgi:ubiquinone biosynthesis protein